MYFYGSTTSVVLIKFLVARVGRKKYNPYMSLGNFLLGILLLNALLGICFSSNTPINS